MSDETRSGAADWSGTTLYGHAAVFNTWATIAGLFKERIAPGAFTKTLRDNPDVLALYHHEYGQIIGRTTSGTLRLQQDTIGLRFEVDVDPRSPVGAHVLSAVERRDVHGCSYGFRVTGQSWQDDDDLPMRTITEVQLFEITITPTPAFETTTVSLRADNATAATRRVRSKAEAAMRLRGIAA